MNAMGKDKARTPGRTRDGRRKGHGEAAKAGAGGERSGFAAKDRVVVAQDRARLLRDHFAYLDAELSRSLTQWVTLPIRKFPDVPARMQWLAEQTRTFTEMITRQWEACHGDVPGKKEGETRARIRLLDSLQEALVERDAGLVRRALARRELKRTRREDTRALRAVDFEGLRRGVGNAIADRQSGTQEFWANWEPPSAAELAITAARWFRAQHPKHSERLSFEDWLKAIVAFELGRGERSTAGDKWEILADFAHSAGFTFKEPASLAKEWGRWKKRASYVSLFPVLDLAQSLQRAKRSRVGTPSGNGSRAGRQPRQ